MQFLSDSVLCAYMLQELTETKSLLSESEMKCRNLRSALTDTQALIKVNLCCCSWKNLLVF